MLSIETEPDDLRQLRIVVELLIERIVQLH